MCTLQEVPQQNASDHADGAHDNACNHQAHLAAMRTLALLLGARLLHEVGVAVGGDDHNGAATLVGMRGKHAVVDELGLQLVFGAVGQRASVHELAVDAARAALEIDKALEFAFLGYVQCCVHAGHCLPLLKWCNGNIIPV